MGLTSAVINKMNKNINHLNNIKRRNLTLRTQSVDTYTIKTNTEDDFRTD